MSLPDETDAWGRFADALAEGEATAGAGVDGRDADRIARALHAFERVIELPEDALALDDASTLPLPELPDDYVVEDEIGRGGMGVVYRARQRSLDREVAIKVLRPGELLFGQALKRFQKEARTLARLRHRHIVRIHEVGEQAGQVFFTMDLIRGQSMAELLKGGRMTAARAVTLLRQVASAVAYVHAHGLIHRDLKPANILVDENGDAVVTDFGLALELGGGGDLTLTGQILGTPAYMSPEQARADTARIGEATDVYALGAILYECLTGKRPFDGLSPAEQVYAVIHEAPPAPRKVDRRVPSELELVCLKAMRKNPDHRYPTARAFLEDLERFDEGRGVRARAPSRAYRAGQLVRRHALTLAAGTAAFVAFAWILLGTNPRADSLAQTLRSTADSLRVEGHHDAALPLYERLLVVEDDVGWDVFDGWARASLAVATDALARGDVEGAMTRVDDVAARALEQPDADRWHGRGEIAWLRATAAQMNGAAATDEARRRVLSEWRNAVHEWGYVSGRFVPMGRLQTERTSIADRLLDFTEAALIARDENAEREAWAWLRARPDEIRYLQRLGTDRLGEILEHVTWAVRTNGISPSIGSFRNALRETDIDIVPALLRVAGDESAADVTRQSAAWLLMDQLDIPAFGAVLGDHRADPDRVLPLALDLRDLGPKAGLEARLHVASQAEPEVGPRWRGLLERWRDGHTDLGDETDVHALLERLPSRDDVEAMRVHNRLAQVSPAGWPPPVFGIRGGAPGSLLKQWRQRIDPTSDVERLRVAWLRFDGEQWEIEEETQQAAQVPARIVIARMLPSGEPPGSTGTFPRVPGLPGPQPTATQGQTIFRLEADLDWGPTGLALGTRSVELVHPGGGSSSSSGSSADVGVRAVFAPTMLSNSYSAREPRRFQLALGVFDTGAPGSDEPWTLERWRTALTENVSSVATLAAAGDPMAAYMPAWYLLPIAARVPLPDAVPALRRLQSAFAGGRNAEDVEALAFYARLLAGDAAALDEERADALASRLSGDEQHAALAVGHNGRAWSRLALMTDDPRIRALAFEHLESHLRSAEDPLYRKDVLEDLQTMRAHGIDLPDALAAHLPSSGSENAVVRWVNAAPVLAAIHGLYVLILLSLIARALWPGRDRRGRIGTAAWLVGFSMLALCVRVVADGVAIPPDVLPYAGLAVASWVIGREARGPRASWPAALFGLAAVVSPWADPLAAFFAAAGIVGLVGVASRLRDHDGRALSIGFTLFYVLPVFAFHVLVLVAWIDAPVSIEIDGSLVTPFLIVLYLCVFGVVRRVWQSVQVRRALLKLKAETAGEF